MPQQVSQELGVHQGIDVSIRVGLVVEAHVTLPGRKRQRCGHRDLVTMLGPVSQHRRFSASGQRPSNQGEEQKPTFVRENEGRVTFHCLFLMSGHRWATHPRIRPSSFSRGRRSGIWGVTPNPRSQPLRYRGFIRTSNRRSMTDAIRGAVHRSVAKPNWHGLWSTHDTTCRTCPGVSLGGRPRPSLGANPASPCASTRKPTATRIAR